jgi:HAD superfamily hydrolase (TIGR01457 family)
MQLTAIPNGKRIRECELFLLDLDGTIYLENEMISGAKTFLDHLHREKIPFVFLTNNSSKSTADYITKLISLGIEVTLKNIITSGKATGYYLAQKKPGCAIYVVGTESLKTELRSYGLKVVESADSNVEYVVVGFDTELTYDKLIIACKYLENGAGFIATNPDLVCPMKNNRYIPDCGSICQMIINTTNREPVFIGKPHSIMIDIIKKEYPVSVTKMITVGDRLYTDIALGISAGIYSVCVLTGESTIQNIRKSPFKPDLVIDSIDDLNGCFGDI